ncbi:glucose 1-dehydrogenase [Tistrella bauzanensis]|uniref:Glucose 1-dehydrogenase n=1 Tax=Tistrella arctica TaxID=3133430 RepID=A0ABU9YQU4_9PROT
MTGALHPGQLDGRVVLLTGAASGIGAACAERMLNEGARVMMTDIDATRGRLLADRLGEIYDDRVAFTAHDVTDEAAWRAAIDAVGARFGTVGVVVNNAGVLPALCRLEDTSLEEWRRVSAVNLDGVFLGVKHAILAMKQTGGAIVNISSVAAMIGMPITGAYNATKAGVHMLTKCAALECAHLGYPIRVNSVHPGYVRTEMTEAIAERLGGDRFASRMQAVTPMRRLGEPREIADAVVFLASDRASYATGTALVIDGGWTAQ